MDALVARLPGRRRRLAGRSRCLCWLCVHVCPLRGSADHGGNCCHSPAAGHGLPYDLPYDLDGEAGGVGAAPFTSLRPAPARGAYSVLPAAEPPPAGPQTPPQQSS